MKCVSEKALLQRLNRRLRQGDLRIRVIPERVMSHGWLGRYCLVDSRNHSQDRDVHIEAMAREMGLMREHERLGAS